MSLEEYAPLLACPLLLRPGLSPREAEQAGDAIGALQALLDAWGLYPDGTEIAAGVYDEPTRRAVHAFQDIASEHTRRIPVQQDADSFFVEAEAITLSGHLPGAVDGKTREELALWLERGWCWMAPRYIEEATSRWAPPGPYTSTRGEAAVLKLGSTDNEGEANLRSAGQSGRQNTYHEHVYGLQADLHELGFGFCGNDGWFGPETEKAVRAFQRYAGGNPVREQRGSVVQVEITYRGEVSGRVDDATKAELALWLTEEYRQPSAPEAAQDELAGDLDLLLEGVRKPLDPQGRQALAALTKKMVDGQPILATRDAGGTLLKKLHTFATTGTLHPHLVREGFIPEQALRDVLCVLADPGGFVRETELSRPDVVRTCRELPQLAPNLYTSLVFEFLQGGNAEIEGGEIDEGNQPDEPLTRIIDCPAEAFREDFSGRCLPDRMLQETLKTRPGVVIALLWKARGKAT